MQRSHEPAAARDRREGKRCGGGDAEGSRLNYAQTLSLSEPELLASKAFFLLDTFQLSHKGFDKNVKRISSCSF